MSKKKIIIFSSALVVIILVVLGLNINKGGTDEIEVQTQAVSRGKIVETVTARNIDIPCLPGLKAAADGDEIGLALERRQLLFDDRLADLEHRAASEGAIAVEHLVEDRAQCIDVDAVVHLLAHDLLGGQRPAVDLRLAGIQVRARSGVSSPITSLRTIPSGFHFSTSSFVKLA